MTLHLAIKLGFGKNWVYVTNVSVNKNRLFQNGDHSRTKNGQVSSSLICVG